MRTKREHSQALIRRFALRGALARKPNSNNVSARQQIPGSRRLARYLTPACAPPGRPRRCGSPRPAWRRTARGACSPCGPRPGWRLPPGTWPYSVQDLVQPALPLRGPRDDFGPRDSSSSARPPGGGLLAILAEQNAAWDPSTSGLLGTARPAANSDCFGSPTPAGDWSSSAPHSTSMILSPENLVRIPRFKHWEINSLYMTKNKDYRGLSPREYLRGKPWAERVGSGLDALKLHGVLRP
jgi:hypothetical protein